MKRGDLVTERGVWLQAQVLHPGPEQTVVIMQDHVLHQIPREHTACTKDLVPWSEFQRDRGERYLKSNTLKPLEQPPVTTRKQARLQTEHDLSAIGEALGVENDVPLDDASTPKPLKSDILKQYAIEKDLKFIEIGKCDTPSDLLELENDAPSVSGPCPEKGRKFDFECDCGVMFRSTGELEEHKSNCMVVNSLEAWYT